MGGCRTQGSSAVVDLHSEIEVHMNGIRYWLISTPANRIIGKSENLQDRLALILAGGVVENYNVLLTRINKTRSSSVCTPFVPPPACAFRPRKRLQSQKTTRMSCLRNFRPRTNVLRSSSCVFSPIFNDHPVETSQAQRLGCRKLVLCRFPLVSWECRAGEKHVKEVCERFATTIVQLDSQKSIRRQLGGDDLLDQ